MLEVINAEKKYKGAYAVNGVSFKLGEGKVYGLVGLNGAGKSTLMKLICSLARLDGGEILWNGEPVQKARKNSFKLGYMIEEPAFFKNLSGRDNLRVLVRLYENLTDDDVEAALVRVGLYEHGDKKFGKYSTGMKQRLHFAYALINEPDALILDEPFNGVDPITVRLFKDIITTEAKRGKSVLISSHSIADIASVCSEVFVMKSGKLIKTVDDLKSGDTEDRILRLLED